MSAPLYQRHEPDQKSMSDSFNKLARLKLPEDMRGMSYLDVGCNEGFFCNIALKRGAKRIVGIDFYKTALQTAKELYPSEEIDFRLQSWETLPEGPFDVILWSSSMHYEHDPAAVLRNMHDRLTPNGTLILECGVAHGPTREMVRVNRHSDSRWYPTEEFLQEELLAPFSFRRVAWPETTDGDPVPRSVYHCNRHLPVVFLVRGRTHEGKSTVTREVKPSATKSIALDLFFYRIREGRFHPTATDQFIHTNYDPNNLTAVYEGIDHTGLTDGFAAILAQIVSSSDRTVVFDGALTDAQADALTVALDGKAVVWDMARRR